LSVNQFKSIYHDNTLASNQYPIFLIEFYFWDKSVTETIKEI